MSQELLPHAGWLSELWTEVTPEEAMIQALDAAWLDNARLAKETVNILNKAMVQNNNWDKMEDFRTKADILKFVMNTKMKKKSWVQVNILNSHFAPPSTVKH